MRAVAVEVGMGSEEDVRLLPYQHPRKVALEPPQRFRNLGAEERGGKGRKK